MLTNGRLLFSTWFIFALCVGSTAQPDEIKFKRFSLEQGLSESYISCILQDRRGFMWFGTQDGLDRFDGYGFTIFKHNAKDPNSISNNYVTSICEDRYGSIWVGTMGGGLNRFDPKSQHF